MVQICSIDCRMCNSFKFYFDYFRNFALLSLIEFLEYQNVIGNYNTLYLEKTIFNCTYCDLEKFWFHTLLHTIFKFQTNIRRQLFTFAWYVLNNCDDDIMQSSVLFYSGIEDDQYLENSTRISYDAENNVNVDLLASYTVEYSMFF